MKIKSYGNKKIKKFDLEGVVAKGAPWANVQEVVRRKLDILIYAQNIEDLKAPPNNNFEWLKGGLKGFASIRINKKWRIIFKVNRKNQLEEVEVVDYHRG